MTSENTQTRNTDAPDKSGWSASLYNRNASFVYSAAFTSPVLDLLAAQEGEKIIDFGCGSGEVTLELEKIVRQSGSASAGVVVGVDSSESMIERARENGLEKCFVADVQRTVQVPEAAGVPSNGYDAVFTNATLHWCKENPAGVLESAKRLLRPGGRFVGIRSALHSVLERRRYDPKSLDPWYFPSPEEYSKLLSQHGFEVQHISLNPRLTPLPAGMEGWLEVFVRSSWLKNFDDEEAKEIMNEVEKICRVDCQDGEGNWSMTYVRLRFVATLK
ncbi:hypothetical protein V5O48_005755 [Marasmius crinis-equi]|uniref:Methyltransferase domain-containing protein n=1 Tax=Marasmius crinis-equi TaxID=585013 RepID=A0ABR3FLL1_9AGAR